MNENLQIMNENLQIMNENLHVLIGTDWNSSTKLL